MKSTKYIFTLLASALVLFSAQAQGPNAQCPVSPENRVSEHCTKLTTTLKLSDAQNKQLVKILSKYNKQNKACGDQMRKSAQKMQQNRVAQRSAIEKMLTPEQKIAFAQMSKGHQSQKLGKGCSSPKQGSKALCPISGKAKVAKDCDKMCSDSKSCSEECKKACSEECKKACAEGKSCTEECKKECAECKSCTAECKKACAEGKSCTKECTKVK